MIVPLEYRYLIIHLLLYYLSEITIVTRISWRSFDSNFCEEKARHLWNINKKTTDEDYEPWYNYS
jgi:hypothetical protein